MKYPLWTISRLSLIATLITASAPLARADVIMDWNAKADAIAAEKQIPPAPHSRALSLMHVAMFEAVNAIEHRYAPYKISLSADRSTSREAAAAVAAHDVLLSIYPNLKPDLDATLTNALAPIADGESKTAGIALGKEAAVQIIQLRANDGSAAVETYRPLTTPGAYVPTVVPLFSTTGATTPWVMTSGSQFRPGPPPALDSEVWTRDVNEIREVGGRGSATRTPEQTTIGRFWFFVGARTYNPIVRQAASAKGMDLVDCARLFALTSITGNDAIVAVFDAKYHYNFWRPITAIRNADLTSNAATPRDPSWLPLGDTPMHPEYPCAHCIVSAAISTVLQTVVGDFGEFSLTSPTAPGVTRKWSRLQDYSDEVSNARIWAGFHYRFSTEVGKDMGRKIGALTLATQLRGVEAMAQPSR
ncbi:vanadium-dependent haloperoxidase [Bradyrhizobium sp. CB1717]|uniref:vanadium-dependent haloperoxidase n=1 Tax=Bradyrhizobium sp. CB1717 TaxID=3039154 RepID=UPI0024B0A95B|nr:vanadium-dependent haloperoxidase [Bradyrhizobium sp. CB1717]WFU23731.1 vanadium-dependent haloperoxidase [Bradyrhizobium sp. CB1717]